MMRPHKYRDDVFQMVSGDTLAGNLALKGVGTTDDFNELAGDGGLARAIVEEGESVDHVTSVAGGVVHGAHLLGHFACGALEQRVVDGDAEVVLVEVAKDVIALAVEFKVVE